MKQKLRATEGVPGNPATSVEVLGKDPILWTGSKTRLTVEERLKTLLPPLGSGPH